MALMFQRLARNFAKNGYFPTDSDSMERILSALVLSETGDARIIDPTAGEGTALAECKQHLGNERTKAYGVELDKERAWHAKQLLDYCIHGDLMDCAIEQQAFGLLFLNPPYGDMAADHVHGFRSMRGRQRLEKLFCCRSLPFLQMGGVMVLLIPAYSLDNYLSQWIAGHFERVSVYLAPDQQFKQVIIFGIRRPVSYVSSNAVRDKLIAIGGGNLPDTLPRIWQDEPYVVPSATKSNIKFAYNRMDEVHIPMKSAT